MGERWRKKEEDEQLRIAWVGRGPVKYGLVNEPPSPQPVNIATILIVYQMCYRNKSVNL